ncbi:UvrD-helicase domain-containing protein [Sneathia sanguinegens]|uniref:UvrD-helicase domain-containing protein n=2 Tax=Sneathia sanguinegens TaxID=40543 RepID=UPI0025826653|nr:UvrD-helicase domain-containing protein [Sneathia sanguinegens]MDU4652254.1 UvrD-helicase domain-containing protein [Sneathia sanguinegens]
MNCEIISASAGTGKTYTMAIKYLSALNNGVNFENILVITFTKKATSEIKERIIVFLEKILEKKEGYIDIISSMKVDVNEENLRLAYEDMIKNSENIKIFTIDSFINKIFMKALAPRKNIYNYEIIENNTDKYINKIILELLSDKKYFKIFKDFYDLDSSSKEIDKYNSIISNILNDRASVYKYLDNFENLKKEKTRNFSYIKNEICEALKDKKSITKMGSSFIKANKITDLEDFAKAIKLVKSKDEINEYFLSIKEELANIYVNEVIIPYNIAYKKLAKICYEIDEKLKFKDNKFTYSDINFYTNKYEIDPSEVFPNIDIIMIDEFQDTDRIQFNIILKLIKKCKKLFIVGDDKQAIYGFRGGDVSLFRNIEKILKEAIPDISIKKLELNTCYRSKKNIINYINQLFSNLNNFKYNKVNCIKDGGYVRAIPFEKDNDFVINSIVENNLTKSTAILARKNDVLDKYKKELELNNIKFESVQSLKLANDVKIKALLKLIDYLINENMYSLLEFLRSDLATYTLEQISAVIKGKKIDEILKLKKCKGNFKKTYLKLFGYGINATNDDKLNINKFLDLVDTYYNLQDFVDYFNEKAKNILKENVSVENCVSLLTIHKSKGLEYDTIYLPLQMKNETFAKYVKVELEDDILLLKKKSYLSLSKFKKYIDLFIEKEELENLNLLYVALTRVKNNLFIIFESGKMDQIFSSFENGKIINNTYKNEDEEKTVTEFTNEEYFSICDEEIKIENFDETSLEKELSRKKGLALHYFMENVKTADDIEYAYSMFLRKYANLVGPKITNNIYNSCVKYIKNNPQIFSSKFVVKQEYEIIDEKTQNKYRIDRMNIDVESKKVIIYDYKTKHNAKTDEKYIKQIENYVRIVKELPEFKNYEISYEILPI